MSYKKEDWDPNGRFLEMPQIPGLSSYTSNNQPSIHLANSLTKFNKVNHTSNRAFFSKTSNNNRFTPISNSKNKHRSQIFSSNHESSRRNLLKRSNDNLLGSKRLDYENRSQKKPKLKISNSLEKTCNENVCSNKLEEHIIEPSSQLKAFQEASIKNHEEDIRSSSDYMLEFDSFEYLADEFGLSGSFEHKRNEKQGPENCSYPNLDKGLPNGNASTNEIVEPNHTNLWGLPSTIMTAFLNCKIVKFFDWQIECLNNPYLIKGSNMIISLPTSGGKTVISEIIILRHCILRKQKALLILPYISLVLEKTKSFKKYRMVQQLRVDSYYNNKGTIPIAKDTDIIVCTYEKAMLIINNMIEENRVSELGCIVIDEFHMMGENERGYLIEILLTKVRYFQLKHPEEVNIQIIGMSATIPNYDAFAKWLGGHSYVNNFRPTPLSEYIKVENHIFETNGNLIRTLPDLDIESDRIISKFKVPGLGKQDIYHIYRLCREVIPNDSVLVFCSSKRLSVILVDILSDLFAMPVTENRKLLVRKLEACQSEGTLDPILAKGSLQGIAYHHSGLTTDERTVVEQAYLEKTLNIICCTSTLAAGVNLPAKRVLLQRKMGVRQITQIEYRQMIGRAGRAGIHESGEAFLLLSKHEKEEGFKMVQSGLNSIHSGLAMNLDKLATSIHTILGSPQDWHKTLGSLTRLVLEGIANGMTLSFHESVNLIAHTFLAFDTEREKIENVVTAIICWLKENGFVRELSSTFNIQNGQMGTIEGEVFFEATPLGQATHRSLFSPKEALIVIQELKKAREQLILSEPLHLCYLVTPLFQTPYPESWVRWSNIFHNLSSMKLKVASIVGINVKYLIEKEYSPHASLPEHIERIIKRFFAALMLQEVLLDRPIRDVCKHYAVSRGDLESLMTSSLSFGVQMVNFCKHMGWWDLEHLLHKYSQTVGVGVKSELLPLTEIKGVKAFRAKVLWESGLRTIKQVASADEKTLETLFGRFGYFSTKSAKKMKLSAQKIIEKTALEMRMAAQELMSDVKPKNVI